MDRREFIKNSFVLGSGTVILSSCSLINKDKQKKYIRTINPSNYVSYVTTNNINNAASDNIIGKMTQEAVNIIAQLSHNKKKGMEAFVKRADKVIIKPNIGWARIPELAATTNPIVIKKIIEMCYDAGASKVIVSDLPANSVNIAFDRTGISKAVKSVDGIISYPKSHRIKEMKLEKPIYLPLDKKEIKKWPIFIDFIEADVIINIPIAKHHNLSKLSIGMKNWYGAVSGRRNQLHQAINESIASLAYHFKPDLTIVDCIRILLRNGPTGGSVKDTKITNTIIASQSQVAADSIASTLFNIKPSDIPYIKIASQMGMGDYNSINIIKKTLNS